MFSYTGYFHFDYNSRSMLPTRENKLVFCQSIIIFSLKRTISRRVYFSDTQEIELTELFGVEK